MRFSILLLSYKEKGINMILKSLVTQRIPDRWKLDKIVVVASGYSDMEGFEFFSHRKIKLITEMERTGKANAINIGLRYLNSKRKPDVIMIQSGDVVPKSNMINSILLPLEDESIGMTTGRPVSKDKPDSFPGYFNNLIWSLHHIMSSKTPKAGEVMAFRNVVREIPKRLATDEAYIESVLKKQGYQIKYVPEAIVYNNGPQTVLGVIEQRRRIYSGHVHIKEEYGYKVSTMDSLSICKAAVEYAKGKGFKDIKEFRWFLGSILIEVYARVLGSLDFHVHGRVPHVWNIVKTKGR